MRDTLIDSIKLTVDVCWPMPD